MISSEPLLQRHSLVVRVAHWLTFVAFCALLLTGVEIVLSHPRFYWGETGNVNMHPLFMLHVASSRATVPTGYAVLPDQNGWSRALHFQSAWMLVIVGMVYLFFSLGNGHIHRDLLPPLRFSEVGRVFAAYLRGERPDGSRYNAVQRWAYCGVIFVLFPLIVWTGLAMSPGFTSAFPFLVTLLGGRQSARTLHFFLSAALLLFVLVHVAMVVHAGFSSKMRGMTLGHAKPKETA